MPFDNANDYKDIDQRGLILGQIYSEPHEDDIITGYNNTASTILIAGTGCSFDSSGDMLNRTSPPVIAYAASTVFAGILALPVKLERRTGFSVNTAGYFGYPPDYEVQLVRKGRVAVLVDDTVKFGDPVFCRHTASGAEIVGTFRNDADTADAVQIGTSTSCIFVSSATGTAAAPQIAIISINLA